MAQQIWNGIFYDDSDFEVKNGEGKEYLHYKGTLTDLRHFELPKGITSTFMMFAGTDIEYGPVIPDTVTDMSYTFLDCKRLIEGSKAPNNVTNQDGEYDGCENVTDVKNFSANVLSINGYAANCASLESVDTIPDSVKSAESALEGCGSIKEVHGGKNVENAKGIYAGMTELEIPSPEMNPTAMMDDAFVGCIALEEKLALIDAEEQQEQMMNKVRVAAVSQPHVEQSTPEAKTETKQSVSTLDRVAAAEAAFGSIASPSTPSSEMSKK